MSLEALQDQFFAALRPSALNIAVARERLEEMRVLGLRPSLHTLYAAIVSQRDSFDNTTSALRTIMDEIVDAPVEDPVIYAKACTEACRFAMLTYNRQAIISLQSVTKTLWSDYSDCKDVVAWRPACELNIGMFYAHVGQYEDALACFNDMLAHFERTPANFCWLTQVYVNLALIYVAKRDVAMAYVNLGLAGETGMPYDEVERMLVAGRIAIALNDHEGARLTLRKARELAKKGTDRFWQVDIDLALCEVYKALGNYDAFWFAHDAVAQVAGSSGMTHVLDALALIRVGVPTT